MAKYLLVAHQTAERQELFDAAKELVAQDSHAKFTLLVPATPVGDLLTWEEGETKEVARTRVQSAAAALQREGIRVVGVRVGDADPVSAVDDEFLAGRRYDTIVISTLPPGSSRWIKMDVVSRLRRKRPRVPVIHVIAEESQPPSQSADIEASRGANDKPGR
ncbi:MAG: hypothetical protein E6H86_10300 [Chloroflexi bacterium]|nr:MAG: hypothetical protein E6H86_10300 [Chloroflexota bacterium]